MLLYAINMRSFGTLIPFVRVDRSDGVYYVGNMS